MPPYSLLFGHLPVVQSVMKQLPPDAFIAYTLTTLSQQFPDIEPVFYLDMEPFGPRFMAIASPTMANQVISNTSLIKPPRYLRIFDPIIGGPNMFTLEGEQWKVWRTIFNPGFNPTYLSSVIPAIVEETMTYCEILREHCHKGDVFQLDPMTINLTLDVIGRVTLYELLSLHSHSSLY